MSLFDLPPPTIWDRFNPRFDCSVWQHLARMVRAPYRRRFHPNGPPWHHHPMLDMRIVIKALNNCSDEEAEAGNRAMERARLEVWLKGY